MFDSDRIGGVPRVTAVFTLAALLALLFIGLFVWLVPQSSSDDVGQTADTAPQVSATDSNATPTVTPTLIAYVTNTPEPTRIPTETPIPPPTDTPQPPRFHTVNSGETLIGIASFYGIDLPSISQANLFGENANLSIGQDVQIPWPTATPPLQPIMVQIGQDNVMVDPRGCERYVIQAGDAASVVAFNYGIDLGALLAVNQLNLQSVLSPGDSLCIPRLEVDGLLPPTPGPTPTASPTLPPAGPRLLYPQPDHVYTQGEMIGLQWLTVKDLLDDEWYMVEVVDLSAVNAHPNRDFTRSTSFKVPAEWVSDGQNHQFRWRITIVKATGERADGSLIYGYGGTTSADRFFTLSGG